MPDFIEHSHYSAAAIKFRAASLALRYALRELRGGLRGFYVFIACIALGVMAIAGVGSVAASLSEGLAREGRTLLGGDAAFSLIQREAKPDEVAFLRSRVELSRWRRRMRGMARTEDGKLALVELKAVDNTYPLLGEVTLDPKIPVPRFALSNVTAHSAPPPTSTLLARLDLKIGDHRQRRQRQLPDPQRLSTPNPTSLPVASCLGRASWSANTALRATGLLQPGSLVRWIYRRTTPGQRGRRPGPRRPWQTTRERRFYRARGGKSAPAVNASPQLERTISRFTQFLTLVGLAALLVGGVGVANAV